jgi:hypothetical protein
MANGKDLQNAFMETLFGSKHFLGPISLQLNEEAQFDCHQKLEIYYFSNVDMKFGFGVYGSILRGRHDRTQALYNRVRRENR